jgi:2-haloacid dehalogenase
MRALSRVVRARQARILRMLVSAEEAGVYKPHPGIYRHLLAKTSTQSAEALLVSCNPFDIAGAGAVGIRAVWCRRNAM